MTFLTLKVLVYASVEYLQYLTAGGSTSLGRSGIISMSSLILFLILIVGNILYTSLRLKGGLKYNIFFIYT